MSRNPRTRHAVMFPKPPPDEVRALIASIERRLRLIDASVETVAQAMLDARIGVEGDTPEDQWEHTVYYAGQFLKALNERLGIEAEADRDLATPPPVPAAPPLTDNQREAIAQQALIGPPVHRRPDQEADR